MDITSNQLKTMKSKQLRNIIREAILEVLEEQATIDVPNPAALTNAQKQTAIQKARATTKNPKIGTADEPVEFVEEGELDELARVAKGFRLADENFDATPYVNKRVSGISMADVIEYFRENPGAEKKDLQAQFNFARPQIANALVNGLLDAGVLVKLGAGGQVELPPAPGEEPAERDEPIRGGEEFLIGPYLDLGTSGTPDTDEEEPEEMEPEPGEIEKAEPIAKTSGMSEEDFQAWLKYSDYKERLNATKSNIQKVKRSKGITDIGPDTKDAELSRLISLKKSLEDRIDALVAGSKYLQDREAKLSKKVAAPIVEPTAVEDEEEDETVAENYAYEKRQLQYRAGIIK